MSVQNTNTPICSKNGQKPPNSKLKILGAKCKPHFGPQNGQVPLNIKMGESLVPKCKMGPKFQKWTNALWYKSKIVC
jgi:hypothetical protein